MAKCIINEGKNSEFIIEIDQPEDLSYFGWTTEQKYKKYSFEPTWANLVDLFKNKDKYNLDITYHDSVKQKIEDLRNQYKFILETNKIKLMSKKEVNDIWEQENFPTIFPKIKKVLDHQKRAVLLNLKIKKFGIFCEQGTGKSIIGTLLLGKLFYDKLIDKALIFAPLSLLDDNNWFGTIDKFSTLTYQNLRDGYSDDAQIHFVNPEQVPNNCFIKTNKTEKSYDKFNIFEIKKFDSIIFDESSYLKNHESLLSIGFLNFSKHSEYISLMSGTPAPEKIFQLFTQMKVLGSILGDSSTAFEKRYGFLRSVGPVQKYFPVANAEFDIRKRIELVSYYVEKEDVLDLKGRLDGHDQNIEVFLNKEHKAIYDKFEKEYVCSLDGTDVDGNKIEARLVTKYQHVVRTKLMQILNGFSKVVDENGNTKIIELPWNPKLDALLEYLNKIIKNKNEHCIIWCRFRWQVEKLHSLLKDEYNSTFAYGGMTKDHRIANIDKWLNDSTCQVMIAHPGTVKFGHTWNKAIYSIYFSCTDKFEDYSQSRDRNYRYGQDRQVIETKIIVKNSLEPILWTAMRSKKKIDKFMKEYLKKEIKEELK